MSEVEIDQLLKKYLKKPPDFNNLNRVEDMPFYPEEVSS